MRWLMAALGATALTGCAPEGTKAPTPPDTQALRDTFTAPSGRLTAQSAQAVVFWLLGSLAQAEWSTLPLVGIMFALAMSLMVLWRRRLDVLSLGDETARSLGVDPGRTRTALVLAVALSVGASVAVSGGIGFIGLAIPHMARRLVGVTHALGLPAAAMLGAGTLVWADVVARLILQPREMPIGIITGLIGAPVLVVLVRRLQSIAD